MAAPSSRAPPATESPRVVRRTSTLPRTGATLPSRQQDRVDDVPDQRRPTGRVDDAAAPALLALAALAASAEERPAERDQGQSGQQQPDHVAAGEGEVARRRASPGRRSLVRWRR